MVEVTGIWEVTEPGLGSRRANPEPCSRPWQLKAASSLSSSLPQGSTNLDTKDVLTVVAFEQGPLRRLALQQVGADGHLPTCHVSPKTLTDSPEGQVPTLGAVGNTDK